MTSNEILKADVLDILFDDRNKQYGAYALRKNYNHRLSMALGVSLSSVLLLFFVFPKNQSSFIPSKSGKDVVKVTTIEIPKIKVPEPIIPPRTNPVEQVRQRKMTTIKIEQDDKVKTVIADQTELSKSIISNISVEGGPSLDMAVVKQPVVSGATNEEPKTVRQEAAIQREPEFPGGQEAWLNFLQRNLMAPDELEAGEKKTVSIRFLVATDGSVTGFEVLKSAGKSFDTEVIRVLRKMPKWKPALQNGQPVARAFTQPVTFVGLEQ
jgi:protein TonB